MTGSNMSNCFRSRTFRPSSQEVQNVQRALQRSATGMEMFQGYDVSFSTPLANSQILVAKFFSTDREGTSARNSSSVSNSLATFSRNSISGGRGPIGKSNFSNSRRASNIDWLPPVSGKTERERKLGTRDDNLLRVGRIGMMSMFTARVHRSDRVGRVDPTRDCFADRQPGQLLPLPDGQARSAQRDFIGQGTQPF